MQMWCATNQSKGFRTKSQSGMTLVEVTTALALAGLAIIGIISGYNFSTQANQKSSQMLAASAMAVQRLEETRSVTWTLDPAVDQLYETNFPDRVVTLDMSGDGKVTVPATIYTHISQVSTQPPLKRIRVDCVWYYQSKQLLTNSIETCRAPKS